MTNESLCRHVHIKAAWLSACTVCFFTVARGPLESDLLGGETEHRCPGAFFKPNQAAVTSTLAGSTAQTRHHA